MKDIFLKIGRRYQEHILIILGAVILFLINVIWIEPVYFGRWDGTHFWCSSSTIKFVNNWLQEGALHLKFIMLENPNSIEFGDLIARQPYVSYPSLSCAIPFVIARLCGMSQIDARFIRRVAVGIFGLDTIIVSLIAYVIGKHCTKIRNSYVLICGAIGVGFWWSMLPASQYYLKNIYFADQAVLFWIYLMVLIELYLETHQQIYTLGYKKHLFFIFRFVVILFGMWTDYYFWVFMFVAFLLRFSLNGNRMPIIKNIIEMIKNYVLPVFLSVVMFAAQISCVPNGWDALVGIFWVRTSSSYNGRSMYEAIWGNVKNTLSSWGGIVLAISATIVLIYIFCQNIIAFRKKKKIEEPLLGLAAGLLVIPPFLQILFLKNHSGIHEFSMIKLGVPCIFGAMFIVLVLNKILKQIRGYQVYVSMAFLLVLLTIGTTLRNEEAFYSDRIWASSVSEEQEELTYAINQYFRGYNIVLFSCTEAVDANPPMLLARSGKRVYRINTYSDIIEMFSDLNGDARKIFIVSRDGREGISDIEILERLTEENLLFVSAFYEFYEL